ncbi:heat shock protein [Desulfocucumis palustris]|uniref:Heat shock protein n=1 Tax=Desulfocucumis palustris TaxID=1898651 RepID=A0A2L2X7R2_9FIRM|nr:Hsp20/alpha crystallin family protein [Desulfocucumis palustris]GBF32040.1 heat shock protein [Desulfocucumis palustris]
MVKNFNPFDYLEDIFEKEFFQNVAGFDMEKNMDMLKHFGFNLWPPVNIEETAAEVIVSAEIPGLQDARGINLKIKGNTLKIEGELNHGTEILQETKKHRQERRTGKFSRNINLPASVSSRDARATYRHGVLEIRLTKILHDPFETIQVQFIK